MTYQQAAELGHACGLSEPAEFVNNIALHAMNLFAYGDIPQELAELHETAAAAGVVFSADCGHATLAGEDTAAVCYVCRKLPAVRAGGGGVADE